MLTLHKLACKRDEAPIFEPVSMQVEASDCVEVLGPNGAGKTTLLRTLAGLHGQYEGSFAALPSLYQGHRVGLDELMSAVENLQWFGALQGVCHSEEALGRALARVDMTHMAMTPVQRMSQGQQRRVSMARWLLSNAKLWLLDEPYTSLDRAGQQLLNDILAAHCAAGGVVVAATHVPLTMGNRRALDIKPIGVGR